VLEIAGEGVNHRYTPVDPLLRRPTPLCHFVTSPPQGGRLKHTKIPRAKISPSAWGIFWSGSNPDLWGAGEWPVVVGKMWLGAFTCAPPVRDSCAFRAQAGLLPAKLGASPGRFRLVRSFGDRTPPLPTRARQSTPSDAAGMCRAGICGDAAGTGRDAARTGCGSNAAGRHPNGGSRFRPFAPKTLAAIHLDPAGPGADRGSRFASFRPAGTAPAHRNSPPSASQSSVGPGHPFKAEGRASVTRGWRGWIKCQDFFVKGRGRGRTTFGDSDCLGFSYDI